MKYRRQLQAMAAMCGAES